LISNTFASTDEAALTGEYVTIDGCRLQYRWHGPRAADAPTLVFLHEGLGSIAQWKDFPADLCARTGFGGLVYNRHGYGGSDSCRPLSPRFMHREALEVLPRLLEAFGITQPVLFGHSDGGSIALIYAGSGVPPPAAIVSEAPHVFVEDVTVARIAELRDAYRSTGLRARLERHHGANVDRLFDGWTRTWLSTEFRDWNIEEYLPHVTCPVMVIQGADDEYGTVEQVSEIAGAVSGGAETLVLDACGHAPHIDQREKVLDATVTFLQKVCVHR
jgi:pimeloyl-ACP methyl ester carboxylesterase